MTRPAPAADPDDAPPGVRLDVRLGGPPTPHPLVEGGEFLVGGGDRCKVRLPGTGVPDVVGRFVRLGDAVTFRRLAPAFPVLVNGELIGLNPVPLEAGDRVAVGPADFTVHREATHLRPAFFPVDPAPAAEPDDRRRLAAEWEKLAEATRELEADRVLWYRRRQEMEAEQEMRNAEFGLRNAQPEDGSDQSAFRSPHSDIQEREDRLAAELANFERQRREFADDLLRLDRRQVQAGDQLAEAERQAAEIDRRYDQLRRDAQELEEHVALAQAEREELAAEQARLVRQKTDQDAHARKLAERSAQIEAQQATLAVLRTVLDRQQEEARQEAAQLAADRDRVDDAQAELAARLHEAERRRADLIVTEAGTAERERVAAERAALLDATLAEIHQQKAALAAEQARLHQKEADLDARSADTAEQTALLRGRLQQALDLQARLEADRSTVREKELALTDADVARQTFQEQLRRRAEELTARSRHLDDAARRVADDAAELDRRRAEVSAAEAAVARQAAAFADREAALARQVQRLQEAGRATAAARKEVATAAADLARRRAEFDALLGEVPALDAHAAASQERLAAARELLRGHLGELHAFAGQTRQELDAARTALRAEADTLDRQRADHRLAVSEFRQQLLTWQATIAELKQAVGRSETQSAAAERTARDTAEQAAALASQAAALEQERRQVADRRAEVERHLDDMREWYRAKLRELAWRKTDSHPEVGSDHSALRIPHSALDLDPADRQLGEMLRGRGLVDADTLDALWADARRQRKTLRQTLLASGAVTLYQLSLIEAGDLDRLHVGRLRLVDRVRATGREVVYRVSDPDRPEASARGLVLRQLADAEADDAVRPDEFRQRFAAAARLASPHLWRTLDVLDVAGRPAAVQEQPDGLPAADWPAEAATPGVWLRLLTEAAAGLSVAHAAGLVHGRLTESHVWLSDGTVKLSGVGEPGWLAGGDREGTPADDLRALGALADGWARLGGPRKRGRGKPFPDTLLAVVRRLTAPTESPMADAPPGATPYPSAEDLLDDLHRLGKLFPCPPDAWQALAGATDERQAA